MDISRFLLPVSLVIAVAACAPRQRSVLSHSLHNGDIVLQAIPCGGLCDAIIETTPCAPGKPYNHCGLVHKDKNGRVTVIEAIGKAVKETPLDTFLKREAGSALAVARPKAVPDAEQVKVLQAATAYIGTPYDDVFVPGDTALYCSELVYEAYRKAGLSTFSLAPMTFKSPRTGATYPAWEAYYRDMKYTIPEGLPGINPCAIAVSPEVEMIYLKR